MRAGHCVGVRVLWMAHSVADTMVWALKGGDQETCSIGQAAAGLMAQINKNE